MAATIAGWFEDIARAIGGETAALVSMYIATALLSEIITNNAAAALMYPIAATLGDALGIAPQLISVSIMLGASASFVIPVGYVARVANNIISTCAPRYQCNLMVYAAGNYRVRCLVRIQVTAAHANPHRPLTLSSSGLPCKL